MANSVSRKKNKHLTPEDRRQIDECLCKRMTLKDIAGLIGKDPTAISYEVKHLRRPHTSSNTALEQPCRLLFKAPFVCNGCPKRHSAACHYVHYLCRSAYAQNEYKTLLSQARERIPINRQESYETDRIISSGLKKGQHIYHIPASSDSTHYLKSAVYRHFSKGCHSASLFDLPRAVKFKKKIPHKEEFAPKGIKVGRIYDDFLLFVEREHIYRHVELYTVKGCFRRFKFYCGQQSRTLTLPAKPVFKQSCTLKTTKIGSVAST